MASRVERGKGQRKIKRKEKVCPPGGTMSRSTAGIGEKERAVGFISKNKKGKRDR